MAEIVIRKVPRHYWVRPFVVWGGEFEPGRGWIYNGIIRRDAWQIGKLGFGLMRMPYARITREHDKES